MKQFIILANQRSGSTLLYKLLDSNPEIFCMDEVFRIGANTHGNFTYYVNKNFFRKALFKVSCNKFTKNYFPNNPILRNLIIRFLDKEKYLARKIKSYEFFGYKLMYNQYDSYKPLSSWIREKNVHVIHLIRQNALKLHLSWLTRIERNLPHSTEHVDNVKVYVDPNTIIDTLSEIVNRQKKYRQIFVKDFSNNPYIEIYYEQLQKGFNIPVQKILSFLKIKNQNINAPQLKKLNLDSVSEIILNYDDVHKKLIKTSFKKFLDS